jgi:hypothetical protein
VVYQLLCADAKCSDENGYNLTQSQYAIAFDARREVQHRLPVNGCETMLAKKSKFGRIFASISGKKNFENTIAIRTTVKC